MTHLTAEMVALVDALVEEPPNGARVFALTHGGRLVETIWNSRSKYDYDGWMRYPKIPAEIKERQSNRYK